MDVHRSAAQAAWAARLRKEGILSPELNQITL
jgi:hypothetical protein